MPGIADVQPKQISSLGQPLVTSVEPVVTPSIIPQFVNALRAGIITSNEIADRMGPEAQAKKQVARELVSPEAIQARSDVQKFTSAKARQEYETSLTKDFVDAYLRYNLPLKKTDGTPDYSGMAEVGQKYADSERMLKYAELGLKGNPVQSLDDKGRKVTRFINTFGEDITEVPGKVNKALREYQNMARKARTFLLQNDNEPDVPEGGEAPGIQVSPKSMEAPARTAAPIIAPSITPGEARAKLFDANIMPQSTAVNLTDQEALDIFESYQAKTAKPAAPRVVIEPTATGQQKVVIEPQARAQTPASPFYTGEGLVTETTFDPDKVLGDLRGTELYKNWAEKTPAIAGFRSAVAAYQEAPEETITTQKDIDLANLALQIAAPGATAGGRAMESYRVQRIEEAIPLLERLLDLPDIVLKRNKFPKETRDRIIAVTDRKVQSLENLGRGTLTTVAGRMREQGLDPEQYLFEPEKQLLASQPAGGAGSAPSPRGRTVNLPSGRRVVGW